MTVILILLAVLAAAAVVKFAFLDRYARLADLHTALVQVQEKVEANREEIKKMEAVTEDSSRVERAGISCSVHHRA